MENNIFQGAKFGDKFVTRDGRVALYIEKYDEDEENIFSNILITQGDEYTMFYGNEGESEKNENDDIVSRYQEPIDEDSLFIQKRDLINKACEWIKNNISDFVKYDCVIMEDLMYYFKQAMDG